MTVAVNQCVPMQPQQQYIKIQRQSGQEITVAQECAKRDNEATRIRAINSLRDYGSRDKTKESLYHLVLLAVIYKSIS